MKKTRFITIFIVLNILFTVFVPGTVSAVSDSPEIDVNCAILVDVETGTVLYEKESHKKAYPASITKIMTSLLAVEAIESGEISLNDVVTASTTFEFDLDADGSSQGILPGEELSVRNLLYCIMLSSANEACNIIAEYICGDVQTFIERMNTRAAELGCVNTKFVNTHGLHHDEHYTTAYDIYLMASEALKHPLFSEMCSVAHYEVPPTNLNETRYLNTTNQLLLQNKTPSYYYSYAKGIKTGYTSKAGNCLAAVAEKNGLTLVSVVLGGNSTVQEDNTILTTSFTSTISLFEYGFNNFSYQYLLNSGDLITEVPVALGDGSDYVVAYVEDDIHALLANDFNTDDIQTEIKIFNEDNLTAPITEGEVLGKVTLSIGDRILGSSNLLALTSLERSQAQYITQKIKNTFRLSWVKVLIILVVLLAVFYIIFTVMRNIKRSKARKRARLEERRRRELANSKRIEDAKRDYFYSEHK